MPFSCRYTAALGVKPRTLWLGVRFRGTLNTKRTCLILYVDNKNTVTYRKNQLQGYYCENLKGSQALRDTYPQTRRHKHTHTALSLEANNRFTCSEETLHCEAECVLENLAIGAFSHMAWLCLHCLGCLTSLTQYKVTNCSSLIRHVSLWETHWACSVSEKISQ